MLYRRPNISAASDAIIQIRKGSMGQLVPTGIDAPFKLMRILEGGGHVAMLVNQHYVNGIDMFILWPALQGQPVHRRLARHIECPIQVRAWYACPADIVFASSSPPPSNRAGPPTAKSMCKGPCRRSHQWWKAGCESIPISGFGSTGAGAERRFTSPTASFPLPPSRRSAAKSAADPRRKS